MNFEKINNSQWDMNYASVSFVIQWINSTGHLDIVDMGWSKNLILVLPQLSVIIVISHVPQLCFKQLPATSSIHCTFYHF